MYASYDEKKSRIWKFSQFLSVLYRYKQVNNKYMEQQHITPPKSEEKNLEYESFPSFSVCFIVINRANNKYMQQHITPPKSEGKKNK